MFPRLPQHELEELASDIKEHGLREPITLTSDGLILDGINREAACQLAGVKPETTVYEGDPAAFVISQNIRRRHLTVGQRAVVEAKLKVTAATAVTFSNWIETAEERTQAKETTLKQALYVVRHASDLADQVLAGLLGLDTAYQEARKRKLAAEAEDAKLTRLQQAAPDLYDRVVEDDSLNVDEMLAAAAERERKAREERRRTTQSITDLVDTTATYSGHEESVFELYDEKEAPPGHALTVEQIDQAISVLQQWKELLLSSKETTT
jgi:hypothetical protein